MKLGQRSKWNTCQVCGLLCGRKLVNYCGEEASVSAVGAWRMSSGSFQRLSSTRQETRGSHSSVFHRKSSSITAPLTGVFSIVSPGHGREMFTASCAGRQEPLRKGPGAVALGRQEPVSRGDAPGGKSRRMLLLAAGAVVPCGRSPRAGRYETLLRVTGNVAPDWRRQETLLVAALGMDCRRRGIVGL